MHDRDHSLAGHNWHRLFCLNISKVLLLQLHYLVQEKTITVPQIDRIRSHAKRIKLSAQQEGGEGGVGVSLGLNREAGVQPERAHS